MGNQMFQYAFARYLQEKNKIDFEFNLYNFRVNNTEIEYRDFALSHFDINSDIAIRNLRDSIRDFEYYKKWMKTSFLVRRICTPDFAMKFLSMRGCITTLENPYAIPYAHLVKKSGVICGGFQTGIYLKDIQELIKKELRIITPLSGTNIDLFKKISCENSVAVHIRRGDYLNPRYANLNICGYSYYKKAIDYCENNLSNPIFFVFSNSEDDINWIKNNYNFIPSNSIFVSGNADYEDMLLMYSCKHFVISNSTFSWWAQYLSANESKLVIAPNIWNKALIKESQVIYQSDWVLIGD